VDSSSKYSSTLEEASALLDLIYTTVDDLYTTTAVTANVAVQESRHLLGRVSENLTVKSPINLTVETDEDGTFIVSDDIFLVYGTGDTEDEALDDYVLSLEDYHDLVEAESHDPRGKLLMRRLERYLQVHAEKAA
jgi:hypothetical protein